MSFADKFSIAVLILSFLGQLFNRQLFAKHVKSIFFFVISVLFGSSFYYAFLLYKSWKTNPLSVLLLPPHRDWSYFVYYAGSRIFAPFIVALVFALIFKFVSEFLNRRFNERFLETEESWLFALGIFGTGYPGFIFYAPLMLVTGLLLSFFYAAAGKGRAPFFYLWLPVAIFAILLKSQIPQSALNFLII